MDVKTFRRLYAVYAAQVEALLPGRDRTRLLQVLEAFSAGPVTQKQIGKILGVKHPAVVDLVKSLRANEMVEDSPAREGRAHPVQLSKHGRVVLARFEASLEDVVRKAAEHPTKLSLKHKEQPAERIHKAAACPSGSQRSRARTNPDQLPLDVAGATHSNKALSNPETARVEAQSTELEHESSEPPQSTGSDPIKANNSAESGVTPFWQEFQKRAPEKIKAWEERQAAIGRRRPPHQ